MLWNSSRKRLESNEKLEVKSCNACQSVGKLGDLMNITDVI